jgi:hypothetical protein
LVGASAGAASTDAEAPGRLAAAEAWSETIRGTAEDQHLVGLALVGVRILENASSASSP